MTHVFKHPSYYKRIRAANKDQAISGASSTEQVERAPDPGHKSQAASTKPQAPSSDKKE